MRRLIVLTVLLAALLLPMASLASARSLGVIVEPSDSGLVVIGLTPNGPADQAGLQRGDRLLEIGQRSLVDADGQILDRYLQEVAEGGALDVTIERNGRQLTVELSPESLIAPPSNNGDPFLSTLGGRIPSLQAQLMANNDGLGEYLGTDEGVVVLSAEGGNVWALRSGDVILSVGGQAVQEPADISRIARQSGPGALTVEVLRSGSRELLEVVIGRDWPPLAPVSCTKDDIPSTTPSSDFIVIEDGSIVRHRPTGLEWMRCALGQEWDGETCRGGAERMTWTQALERIDELDQGWRLPHINELQSIVEHCRSNPSINRQAFPNTPALWFWSATESTRPLPLVWVVWFSRGGVDDYHRGSAIHVRPVRGQPDRDFVLPR